MTKIVALAKDTGELQIEKAYSAHLSSQMSPPTYYNMIRYLVADRAISAP